MVLTLRQLNLVLDFKGSAALQSVSVCPLYRYAGTFHSVHLIIFSITVDSTTPLLVTNSIFARSAMVTITIASVKVVMLPVYDIADCRAWIFIQKLNIYHLFYYIKWKFSLTGISGRLN